MYSLTGDAALTAARALGFTMAGPYYVDNYPHDLDAAKANDLRYAYQLVMGSIS